MFFESVAEGAPDPIFGLTATFRADPRPHKIDLMVGIYKNEHLQSELLPSVKKAKEAIISEDIAADYLPIDGSAEFLQEIGKLCFGKGLWDEIQGRVYAAQAVGGTGALRLGGEFVAQEVSKNVFVSHPTWPNHRAIFERAGCQVNSYAYYDKDEHRFSLEAMKRDFVKISERGSLLLHTTCHNPTGCDPTVEEWKEISRLCKEKRLLPFFDFAYQGFGNGIDPDRIPIEIFLRDGHEIVVAYSCSKNFSLYCQRVGALFVVTQDSGTKVKVASQIKRIIRALYSNPPAHGARIATHTLKKFRSEWEHELEAMRKRMAHMRELLVGQLLKKTDRFEFLRAHKGMFSYADLDKSQVQEMIDRYAIYMIDSGRISVAGLNRENVDRVAEAMIEVCR